MTTRTPISFACAGYDRVDALRSGEVVPAGVNLNFLTIDHPREIFDRSMGGHEFDASEMSASEYICNFVAGKRDFVAIPVFPCKVFRHGFIAVNSDQIKEPKDLEGKRVGVQVYTMTAAVWIRGLLAQSGVDLDKIEWVEGGLEHPGRHGKAAHMPLSKPIKITPNNDPNRGLSELLADGEIAATIGADLPSCLHRSSNIVRLFPDFKEAEKRYYRECGVFPIMHLVVIKRSVLESHPWIGSSLFNALEQSKNHALQRMKFLGAFRYMLPWLPSDLDEIEDVFEDTKGDPSVYGLEENRKTLEALVEFLYDQGMIERKPKLEELFHPVVRQHAIV